MNIYRVKKGTMFLVQENVKSGAVVRIFLGVSPRIITNMRKKHKQNKNKKYRKILAEQTQENYWKERVVRKI